MKVLGPAAQEKLHFIHMCTTLFYTSEQRAHEGLRTKGTFLPFFLFLFVIIVLNQVCLQWNCNPETCSGSDSNCSGMSRTLRPCWSTAFAGQTFPVNLPPGSLLSVSHPARRVCLKIKSSHAMPSNLQHQAVKQSQTVGRCGKPGELA